YKGKESNNVSEPAIEVELTRREIQVLKMLKEGGSNMEIADSLFISEHTIKSHLYNIFRKLEVKNRTQATSWAKRNL
ncbi:helix-turn-helix transcriptional regulator, partial [Vibrio parahaemolyticus]